MNSLYKQQKQLWWNIIISQILISQRLICDISGPSNDSNSHKHNDYSFAKAKLKIFTRTSNTQTTHIQPPHFICTSRFSQNFTHQLSPPEWETEEHLLNFFFLRLVEVDPARPDVCERCNCYPPLVITECYLSLSSPRRACITTVSYTTIILERWRGTGQLSPALTASCQWWLGDYQGSGADTG